MADSEPRSTAGGAAAEPQTVGQILRKARVAQELSLEQIAAELRIEPQQLFALEQNQFERIGVPVFVKGYLRQYGQRLGLDHRDLLSVYYKQGKLEEVDIRPSRAIKLRDEQKITGWIVAALILGALVLAVAYWWFNVAGGISPPSAEGAPAAPVEPPTGGAAPGAASAAMVAAPRIEPLPPVSPLAPAESSAVPPGVSTPAASGDTPAAVPPSSTDGGAVATALPATPAAGVTTEPAPAEASATAVDYTAVLDVTFIESSWTEITDARGARLFYDLGTAGRRVTLRGEPPFSVVLGNAGGVRLNLNGEAYEIPTVGRQGSRLDFTLDIAEE